MLPPKKTEKENNQCADIHYRLCVMRKNFRFRRERKQTRPLAARPTVIFCAVCDGSKHLQPRVVPYGNNGQCYLKPSPKGKAQNNCPSEINLRLFPLSAPAVGPFARKKTGSAPRFPFSFFRAVNLRRRAKTTRGRGRSTKCTRYPLTQQRCK